MFCSSRNLCRAIVSGSLMLSGSGFVSRTCAQEGIPGETAQRRFTTSQPKVTPIRESLSDGTSTGSSGSQQSWPWEFVFEKPAHVAWLGFDRNGTATEREAVVIHDGMIVRVNDEGKFDVRFRMEAPLAKITLLMELNVWNGNRHEGKITLPPIRLHPERLDDADISSQSVLVEYTGHSEVLKRLGRQVLIPTRDQRSPNSIAAAETALAHQAKVGQELNAAHLMLKDAVCRGDTAGANPLRIEVDRLQRAKAAADVKLDQANKTANNVLANDKTSTLSLLTDANIAFSRTGTARFGAAPQK